MASARIRARTAVSRIVAPSGRPVAEAAAGSPPADPGPGVGGVAEAGGAGGGAAVRLGHRTAAVVPVGIARTVQPRPLSGRARPSGDPRRTPRCRLRCGCDSATGRHADERKPARSARSGRRAAAPRRRDPWRPTCSIDDTSQMRAPDAERRPRPRTPAADAGRHRRTSTVQFADQLAVDGISLVVPAGTILGIIGPSGAGKTTTIRLLTGALIADQRQGHGPRRGAAPLPPPDPRADRLHAPVVHALPGPDGPRERRLRRRRCSGCCSARGGGGPARSSSWSTCGTSASRRAGRLSGGMQRRLELACALVHDPALLFLDEPTAGIDPLLRGRVWDELHRLRDAGRTLLVTTQYVNEAEACDRVALIAERPADRPGDARRAAPPGGRRRRHRGRDRGACSTAGLLADLPVVRARPPGRPAAPDGHRRRRRDGDARRRRRRSSARGGEVVERARGAAVVRRGLRGARRRGTRRPRPRRRCAGRRRRADDAGRRRRADAVRRRPSPSRRTRRRGGRGMRALDDDDPPAPRARRQGARRGRPPAGRAGQPGPRAVPDHGRLRPRLQRRPAAARDGRRHPARVRPADRRRGYQDLAGGGLHIARSSPTRRRPRPAWPTAASTSSSSPRPTPRRSSGPASSRSSRSRSTPSTRSGPNYAGLPRREPGERRQPDDHPQARSRRPRASVAAGRARAPPVIPPEVVAAPDQGRGRATSPRPSRRSWPTSGRPSSR